ncbi:unnamed protein product [Euphydryas editha]|uniref:Transposase n=1 Tax=Euphydryas editha TaxID=104508 RepID=A0AAU9U581_EUPED|nr:unnamed protein product [Euphydryas editha]
MAKQSASPNFSFLTRWRYNRIVRKISMDVEVTFKCKESPSCICEPGRLEIVLHLLLECPVHQSYRHDLESRLGIRLVHSNLAEIVERSNKNISNYAKSRIVNKRKK